MRAVVSALKNLSRTHRADFIVVNGENSDNGFGINATLADQLFKAGADVVTTGNHVWHDREVAELLNGNPKVLRPDNYPGGAPGSGAYLAETKAGKVAVINLQGRTRMVTIDCPFRRGRDLVKKYKNTADHIVIDFHAESTAEKEAFAHYLDGDATVIYGTHTHVQTADERVLAAGTAYITDVGACLPEQSVIGFTPEVSVRRSLTQLPIRNEPAEGAAVIHGIIVETGDRLAASSIERVRYRSLI